MPSTRQILPAGKSRGPLLASILADRSARCTAAFPTQHVQVFLLCTSFTLPAAQLVDT
jgi:hypothetical protein